MEIHILNLVEGAKKARGITVVIDVFRAFSLAAYAFGNGVKKMIPVEKVETAWDLKEKNPDYVLVGERNEQKIPGFDFGNSPTHILQADLEGQTLIHTTSAGTKGLVNAMHSPEVITGSFVNASAIVQYIKCQNPKEVSLVCMGYAAEHPIEEDTFCAEYIRDSLRGRSYDFEQAKDILRKTSGLRFFEESKQDFSPSSDFDLCLDLNRFNFILKAISGESGIYLQKTEVSF